LKRERSKGSHRFLSFDAVKHQPTQPTTPFPSPFPPLTLTHCSVFQSFLSFLPSISGGFSESSGVPVPLGPAKYFSFQTFYRYLKSGEILRLILLSLLCAYVRFEKNKPHTHKKKKKLFCLTHSVHRFMFTPFFPLSEEKEKAGIRTNL
jgi:hypothetical protein